MSGSILENRRIFDIAKERIYIERIKNVLFRAAAQFLFSLFSLNRVSRVYNERPKNFVYSRNIGTPGSSARKLFGHLFPRIFREPDAARLPSLAGTELFYENPVAESYWNWQAIA